ncbi:MAG: BatA domain-containing protein, partial [Muribaculaceae bacterium]|nr:BatA domain-containing protein [Muribaculaceae bacterium]
MRFLHPGLLFLLLILIPLIAWYVWKWKNSSPYIGISSITPFRKVKTSWKVGLMHLCFILQLIAISALIIALARPQTFDSERSSRVEGTDIVLCLD